MSVPSWVYKRHAIHGDISANEVLELEDFSSALNKEAALGSALLGAGVGAASAGEGQRLKGALAGGAVGAGAGLAGGAIIKSGLRSGLKGSGVQLKQLRGMNEAQIRNTVSRLPPDQRRRVLNKTMGGLAAGGGVALGGATVGGHLAGSHFGREKRASMGWGEAREGMRGIMSRQHPGREIGLPANVSLEELEARRADMRDNDRMLNPQVAAQLGAGAGGLYGALKGRSLRHAAAGAAGGFLGGAGGVTAGRMLSSPMENYMDRTIARRSDGQEKRASVRSRINGMTKSANMNQVGALLAGAALAPVAGHLAMRGVSALGNIGSGRRQERDLQRILEVHPDIGRSEDPRVQMAYQSLVRLNPQYAQDPLIAGPLLKNIVESRTDPTNPSSASYVDPATAGKLTEIYKNQMQGASAAGGFGDDMRRSMIQGTQGAVSAYGKGSGSS